MRILSTLFVISVVTSFVTLTSTAKSPTDRAIETDLLIVGGTESGVAAAVQAARMGVQHIVLVNDIAWLGGQFSAEGVGAIDEWTVYQGKRTNFPRSGLFLEVLYKIREHNRKQYGLAQPGNAFCASDTIEAAAAARIFEELIQPYSSQIEVFGNYQPTSVQTDQSRIRSVTFESTANSQDRLTVRPRLTIDASDWGDVIRLSGASYAAGLDLKSRFGEENAPEGPLAEEALNEMNPITYCMVLQEAGRDATIPKPPHYDERRYYGTTGLTRQEFDLVGWQKGAYRSLGPAFVDTDYPEGIYGGQSNPYTHRRLVDRYHNGLPTGTEKIFLNWPVQDYPLFNYPQHVVAALEATEAGASKKNIVRMTPVQRRIVFEDAKNHTLGMLHHLQTTAHEKAGDYPQSFRYMKLSDEFGTADRLPWKPYVREGLRLEALYMMREQDIKHHSQGPYLGPRWAARMVQDNICGFQFNIDFHPTRRIFLRENRAEPWINRQTENRNWSTHTDCAGFALRSLVPVKMDGLLGAAKNLGYSSIVSSALRLHGQLMHIGQAAGGAAALCLRDGIQPRQLAHSLKRIRELQQELVAPRHPGLGMALWPYFDVNVDDRFFEAANLLAVLQILPGDSESQDFQPWRQVTRRDLARAIARAAVSVHLTPERRYADATLPAAFSDVAASDPDFPYIQSFAAWGVWKDSGTFFPDQTATWEELHATLKTLNLKASEGLLVGAGRMQSKQLPLTRHELVNHLWTAIKALPQRFPDETDFLSPGHDADKDKIPDLDDPLPFDRDNDNLPDLIDPDN